MSGKRGAVKLIDCVCQFPTGDGQVCGAHFLGYRQSLWCPEHKEAGRKASTLASKARQRGLRSHAIKTKTMFIRVQKCPRCRKPLLPTHGSVFTDDVCMCADSVENSKPRYDRVEVQRLQYYNPATHQKSYRTTIEMKLGADHANGQR